jgi:hypothetical protein
VNETVAPKALDRGRHVVRPGLLDDDEGRADPHGKEHDAEPEREGERGGADEAVLLAGPQNVLREAVAHDQHVAMEVHRALRLARGAGREGDEADVVGRGVDGFEHRARPLDHVLERVLAAGAPVDDPLQPRREGARLVHLVGERRVAERHRDLRLVDRVGDLPGAQQRHGRDDDQPGLQPGQVGRDHPGVVRPAQQKPGARDHPEVAHEDVAEPVHPFLQLAVGQGVGRAEQTWRVSPALRDPAVEERDDAVQALGIAILGPGDDEFRPLLGRRQVVAREGVDVGRGGHVGARAKSLTPRGEGDRISSS